MPKEHVLAKKCEKLKKIWQMIFRQNLRPLAMKVNLSLYVYF